MKMTKPKLEQRQFSFEVKASKNADGGSIIEGRPIVFESKTDLGYFDEVIAQGALDKADLSDVRFLVNHDLSKLPLARSRKGSKLNTMSFDIDDNGMNIRVELDTQNNSDARSLYSAVKRGDVTGMSFMFGVRRAEWADKDTDHPTRIIKEISAVVEVSAVTFPAYPTTEINARSTEAVETALLELENLRQQKRASSEEDLNLMKLKAKALIDF